MQRRAQATVSRNRLLSVMGSDDFERLRPHLFRVDLEARVSVEEPGAPITHVYFPEPSVISVVATTASGEQLEVGVVGPEGMTGVTLLHEADRSPLRTFVQVPGAAIRIEAEPFRIAFEESATLRRLLLRYAQAFTLQVSYTALVNGRHTIDERLARWLLMCQDRLDGNTVGLTHEFLSIMLGVRRAGVTTALHVLEGAQVIRSSRGRIEILDRDELQAIAGESYGTAEAEYERLIGAG